MPSYDAHRKYVIAGPSKALVLDISSVNCLNCSSERESISIRPLLGVLMRACVCLIASVFDDGSIKKVLPAL